MNESRQHPEAHSASPRRPPPIDEAASWAIVIDGASPEQREEFTKWLRSSKENVEAFLQVSCVETMLRELGTEAASSLDSAPCEPEERAMRQSPRAFDAHSIFRSIDRVEVLMSARFHSDMAWTRWMCVVSMLALLAPVALMFAGFTPHGIGAEFAFVPGVLTLFVYRVFISTTRALHDEMIGLSLKRAAVEVTLMSEDRDLLRTIVTDLLASGRAQVLRAGKTTEELERTGGLLSTLLQQLWNRRSPHKIAVGTPKVSPGTPRRTSRRVA